MDQVRPTGRLEQRRLGPVRPPMTPHDPHPSGVDLRLRAEPLEPLVERLHRDLAEGVREPGRLVVSEAADDSTAGCRAPSGIAAYEPTIPSLSLARGTSRGPAGRSERCVDAVARVCPSAPRTVQENVAAVAGQTNPPPVAPVEPAGGCVAEISSVGSLAPWSDGSAEYMAGRRPSAESGTGE